MALKILQILLLINGAGIAIIWTRDLIYNPEIDLTKGFFSAREKDSQSLFWPHWLAEYTTALLLVGSVILVYLNVGMGNRMLPFAAGALFYTSLNSLGWAFAFKKRYVYAFPILFSLLVTLIYLFLLIFSKT